MAKSDFKGKLRQSCDLCRRGYYYVSKLTCSLVLKNRVDGDTLVSLTAGALLCTRCVDHNGCERKANPQPLASTHVQCHRCGGVGKVVDAMPHGRWMSRGRDGLPHAGPIANAAPRASMKLCPRCDGEGRVPAVAVEVAS